MRRWLIVVGFTMSLGCAVAFAAETPEHTKKTVAAQGEAFLGYFYKNIKWIKHIPGVADDFSGGQTDVGEVDLDGDKKPETIKVIWGPGVSDRSLTIELYKDNKKMDTLKPLYGIQSNFSVEDVDKDNRKEIVIWSGLWDPRLEGEDGSTDYEGHSADHRYLVVTYKLIRGEYYLWEAYTTKKKYEPFGEKQPVKD